ncbi:aminoglycoside phosphotransferase [Streptomyces sp. NPDC001691]|uniref:aminoglycoside phosphotransferase n=1 Tax=Streptomyces sp. NPDC001691 TaxID=3364600 RepID=UPI0036BE4244
MPVVHVREPRDGANCGFAALLTLADGQSVFVKGQPDGGPLDEFDREEQVSRALPRCAPRVLWRLYAGGWHVMAFEGIDGERAAYEPDSVELGLVVKALTEVGLCVAPRVRLMTVWDRWGYYCDPADRAHLSGLHLLHTDPAPQNLLIDDAGAHLVDWAWPALGPGWVDAALWGVRLMSDGGHRPEQAHRWVSQVPAWSSAAPEALRVFTRAEAASWSDAAKGAPDVANIAQAAREWANYWT